MHDDKASVVVRLSTKVFAEDNERFFATCNATLMINSREQKRGVCTTGPQTCYPIRLQYWREARLHEKTY